MDSITNEGSKTLLEMPWEQIKRSYPTATQGWVNGVYQFREEVIQGVGSPHFPLKMSGSVFVEESEPYDGGDANSIARKRYYEGDALCIPAAARNHQIHVTVESAFGSWIVVVNGESVATFKLEGQRANLSFNVYLSDRRIDVMFIPQGEYDDGDASSRTLIVHSIRVFDLGILEPHIKPSIWITADSTVQTYFDKERPQSGWGEWLYWYLYKEHAASVEHDDELSTVQAMVYCGEGPEIHNAALGARSLRSYSEEGRLSKVLRRLSQGDIHIIQFGLNDATQSRPMRFCDLSSFQQWLLRYIYSTRDRGAIPVLVTPPPQYGKLVQEHDGSIAPGFDDYAEVVRKVAVETQCSLIDLRKEGRLYMAKINPQYQSAMYLQTDAFQWPSHPDGVKDTVHLSHVGARAFARIVAVGLVSQIPGLTFYDDEQKEIPKSVKHVKAVGVRGVVGLEVDLTWLDDPQADFYVVEKSSTESGRVYERHVVLKNSYKDLPLPGQSRHITYSVTAYCAGASSESARLTFSLPKSDDYPPQAAIIES